MWLHSTRIITPAGARAGAIAVSDGRITAVLPDGDLGGTPGASGERVDALELGDRWIAPGFIDTHVHGGGAAQCNTSDSDEILAVARFHARHGTTSLLATTVAAPISELEAALQAIATAARATGSASPSVGGRGAGGGSRGARGGSHGARGGSRGARGGSRGARGGSRGAVVLGAHLEGPFLSRTQPGAMDAAHFLVPSRDMWERLLAVSPGTLAMMTVAPELPGAVELISALATHGVIVSLGHSDATYEQSRDATRAGATAVTHLFNAMRPMHHRDPGIAGAALDLPSLSCELICDGHHVAGPMLRIAQRAKGLDGVRLVTDAIEAAGMPDGDYRLGDRPVTVRAGRAVVPGTDRLAGSTLTMQEAVRGAVRLLGISAEAAVSLASTNPARLLGIADRKGVIAPGRDADLVVLGDDLRVERTMVGGEWLA